MTHEDAAPPPKEATTKPDYRTTLTKFMHTLWEYDFKICILCASGAWRPFEPNEKAAVDEILATLKKDYPIV